LCILPTHLPIQWAILRARCRDLRPKSLAYWVMMDGYVSVCYVQGTFCLLCAKSILKLVFVAPISCSAPLVHTANLYRVPIPNFPG
jgi:hypothetical protein